ncbi:rod shape-determining protein [Salipaludibacillus sp. LMS25]|jgi:cell division protein FtsA|uniref:pilus assembly protein PilM n=1 Tax=Salipaludibacillus sp. LMS25 TaxID=2924031 RepID=UPI0020D19F03|nr:cell division FtsA domain-containing protein [Salipaludibacillus sp. LMS25]UTR15632.1 rod shape-determining protein [Salipaludibacillus sp. LMS25]
MKDASSNLIFGLDIGTRSVVGLMLEKRSQGYHVLDVYSVEHDERSMLDGQIHNVLAVSEKISHVKDHLEATHGKLKKVCVAAAGRSLKTKRALVELDILGKPIFDHQSLLHLELSAVQKAQFELANESANSKQKITDYCVGYSVINYCLDGEVIGSLLDQRGEKASIEVIATFLPKVVVESLISALQRADLELEALTLEPIAAINVLIPSSMRRLNVALVDIGAGTSDIAITDLGTVTAYGMVPNAGDEITEALSDHFLLDFPEAENIKRQLSSYDELMMTDILGMETSFPREEIIKPIEEAINHLADQIAREVLKLNSRAPKAVMLVGGGSMTPHLPEKLAERLELPENRVAIRGIDAIKKLTFEKDYDATPELVTPIGIAIAAKESPVEYISIHVNDESVRLFDIKKLTVGDGLLSSGLELPKLYGKPGMAIMVKVNDRVVSIPGMHGTPPILKKNGMPTELDAPLVHGDHIEVERGANGQDASATIQDVVDQRPELTIIFNGEKKCLSPLLIKNGEATTFNASLKDRDTIVCQIPTTVEEVLPLLHIAKDNVISRQMKITLNGQPISSETSESTLLLNGKSVSLKTPIQNGDQLDIVKKDNATLAIKDVLFNNHDDTFNREIIVTFNGEPVHLEKELYDCYNNSEKVSVDSPIKHGDSLEIRKKPLTPFIFQDVFTKVTIQHPDKEERKKPVILRNNEETSFSSKIHHGDVLQLKWVDS